VGSERQMSEKKRGLLFIISAPSGTGKTTLLKKVMEQLPDLRFSVSYTTRPPRSNEQEGKDYYFISPAIFQKMVDRDEFLEWAEVLGNCYGTAWANIEVLRSGGIDLILDIDSQGAKKVIEKIDHSVLIFILPPSPQALQERIVKRGVDLPETIKIRLAHARREIEEARWYQYVIVNERIDETVERLKSIIMTERCRKNKVLILEEKIRQWEDYHGKNYGGGLS
jgi:guanylate kinase